MTIAKGATLPDGYRGRFTDGLLLERLYHWEQTTPDRVCFTQPLGQGRVRELTFREAVGEVRRIAAHLQSLNLPRGTSIGLVGRNSVHWMLADLAIWMAGHVTVPVFPTLRADGVKYVLDHSEAKVLFVGKLDDWAGMRDGVDPSIHVIALPLAPEVGGVTWDELLTRTAPLQGQPVRGADEVATIVYTSGSTGVPKAVVLTFGAMTRASLSQDQQLVAAGFALGPESRFISYLPLAHVYERIVIEVSWLGYGCHVFLAESVATFLDDLKRARPTFFHSVPRLWQQFYLGVSAKLPPARLALLLSIPVISWFLKRRLLRELGLDQVQLALSASAPASPALLDWYQRLGLQLLEGYGMSEDCACSHSSLPGKVRSGTVGYPCPGVECRLSPEGEVLVKSPGALREYFKDPEATRAAFTEDGFFHTGDRGEHDEAGRLRITGRTKELFKTSKGKYVAPAPIESVLLEDPGVEAACVMGVGFPQPCAVIMLSPAAREQARGARAALEARLREHLDRVNTRLEHHEALEFLVVANEPWTIDNGLMTPTLKFKRSRLEERYTPRLEGWYAAQAPVLWE